MSPLVRHSTDPADWRRAAIGRALNGVVVAVYGVVMAFFALQIVPPTSHGRWPAVAACGISAALALTVSVVNVLALRWTRDPATGGRTATLRWVAALVSWLALVLAVLVVVSPVVPGGVAGTDFLVLVLVLLPAAAVLVLAAATSGALSRWETQVAVRDEHLA